MAFGDNWFAPWKVDQLKNLCGPCSLAACAEVLGINRDEWDIVDLANKMGHRPKREGLGEDGILAVARKVGMTAECLRVKPGGDPAPFANKLKKHLRTGNPVVLCVEEFLHWVAVIGYSEEQEHFFVMNPEDYDEPYTVCSEKKLLNWAVAKEDNEDSLLAIPVARKDGRSPRWRATPAFLKVCREGAELNASDLAEELEEMLTRASPDDPGDEGVPLHTYLAEIENIVVDSADHWTGDDAEATKKEMRDFYKAYIAVAEARGLKLPARLGRAHLIAQMSVSLTLLAAWGEF
jgi:hypothetical protein